jgi:hypothetical protein
MATRSKPTRIRDPNQITATAKPGEDQSVAIARTVIQPTGQAAVTLKEYNRRTYGDLALDGLIDALTEQTRASNDCNLERAEVMLTAQAHTLDAIFNNLARRAINAEYMDNLDRYLKLALRAQSQSRATWEALATIKHPPMMGFVRQANIAHGPQQVNNASAASDGAPRTAENPNLQNKLLGEQDGERLDFGTTCAPGRADPAMATVGAIDRAED